jgi:hypothetical protein
VSAAVLLLVVLLAGGVAAATGRWLRPAGGADLGVRGSALSERLWATARVTARWRIAGLVVGVVVGVGAAGLDVLGRRLLLAAPMCALCVLAGVVAGELRVTSPEGPVRSAGLEIRTVRDYLPRALTRAVAAATVLLAVVLVLTTAAGSPDDLGRAGRTLARQCSAVSGQSVGPWSGSFYSVPLGVVLVSGLLLAGIALRRVVHRPRSGDDPRVDDALRRHAAEAVIASCGLLVAVPLAGVSFFAAHALLTIECAPAAWTVAGAGLGLLMPALAVLAVRCGTVLASPSGGRAAFAAQDSASR